MKQYRVAVVVGSLREQSYNRQLAHALVSLFPAHIQCEFVSIGSLPLYNQDCDAQPPAEVLAFLNMPTLNQPEMYLQWYDGMIGENGKFSEKTGAFVQKWADAYVRFLEAHG